MPTTPLQRKLQATKAIATRWGHLDVARQAGRDLLVEQLSECIRSTMAASELPFTPEQRLVLAGLLLGGEPHAA